MSSEELPLLRNCKPATEKLTSFSSFVAHCFSQDYYYFLVGIQHFYNIYTEVDPSRIEVCVLIRSVISFMYS